MNETKILAELSAQYTNEKTKDNFKVLDSYIQKLKNEFGLDGYIKMVHSSEYAKYREELLWKSQQQ
jgi:hypothetical protein